MPGHLTPTDFQTQGQSYSAPQAAVSPQLPTSVIPLEDVAPIDPAGVLTAFSGSCYPVDNILCAQASVMDFGTVCTNWHFNLPE